LNAGVVCAFAQQRIRSILQTTDSGSRERSLTFLSGRRRYVCRRFLVEALEKPALLAVVLERRARDTADPLELARRFRLTPRECETVRHLIHGLGTNEIAQRMRVTPSTVKQFVRLAMGKMGVSTRLGIVSRIVDLSGTMEQNGR